MNKDERIADFVRYTPKTAYFIDPSTEGTSPGGVRDYRSHVADNAQAVGIGSASVEQTLDIGYVFRPAPGAPFERPRGLMPGEIGWGIPWLVDLGVPKPGEQLAVKK
ncbi:hypothetical protein BsWGS_06066 [Bradybaena similaris]